VKAVAVSAAAGGGTDPQGDGVGGICLHGGHAGEQECRECDETSTARNRVESAAYHSGKKKKDGCLEMQ
jgi:hypothetical protein